jgi:hypothetical protein
MKRDRLGSVLSSLLSIRTSVRTSSNTSTGTVVQYAEVPCVDYSRPSLPTDYKLTVPGVLVRRRIIMRADEEKRTSTSTGRESCDGARNFVRFFISRPSYGIQKA